MGDGWRQDRFWARSLHACAPLALWAAHFFGSYLFVAVGCRAKLDSQVVLGLPLLTLGLIALTLAALGWLTLMLFGPTGTLRARRRHSGGAHGDTLPEISPGALAGATAFRSGAAVLSLVAVAWTAVPMMLLQSCGQ